MYKKYSFYTFTTAKIEKLQLFGYFTFINLLIL